LTSVWLFFYYCLSVTCVAGIGIRTIVAFEITKYVVHFELPLIINIHILCINKLKLSRILLLALCKVFVVYFEL
ncbi:hypothetical protein OZD68_00145, partial [Wolbachia endosymbiont of Drosophila bicornuta]